MKKKGIVLVILAALMLISAVQVAASQPNQLVIKSVNIYEADRGNVRVVVESRHTIKDVTVRVIALDSDYYYSSGLFDIRGSSEVVKQFPFDATQNKNSDLVVIVNNGKFRRVKYLLLN